MTVTTAPSPRDTTRDVVLEIDDVSVSFGTGRHANHALREVSLDLHRGRTLGLVGESGSGKSTLAKVLVGLEQPTSGTVRLEGGDLAHARHASSRRIQLIPQDPYASLNPRRTVGQALAEAVEPRRARQKANRHLITTWLAHVQLPADTVHRYPHEFSGGQRQRIAIARALMVHPEIVIADEITSALDVSVQAEILKLLQRLRTELGLTMIFISHNLAVVHDISDDVAVIRRGSIVECNSRDAIFGAPAHPYTRALLNAVPGSPRLHLDPRTTHEGAN